MSDQLQRQWYSLQVKDCPIEVLRALVTRVTCQVATVENFSPPSNQAWGDAQLNLQPGQPAVSLRRRELVTDLQFSKDDFMSHLSLWNTCGVYALFTERPIAMRACDLQSPVRYHVLNNFGFQLEFALAGPTSGGVSSIISPQRAIIQLAEEVLDGLNQTSLIRQKTMITMDH